MKKLIFAIFASLIMVGWGYAQVENNEAVVDQSGIANVSEVFQDGRNYAEVTQEGFLNLSFIDQFGTNKAKNGRWGVFVDQYGAMNLALAEQHGRKKGPGNRAVQVQKSVKLNMQEAWQQGSMNRSRQRQLGRGDTWKEWYETHFNYQGLIQMGTGNRSNQLQKYGLVMTAQLTEQYGKENIASQKMMGDPNGYPAENWALQQIYQDGKGNEAKQLMKRNVDDAWQFTYTEGRFNSAEQVMGLSADGGTQEIYQSNSKNASAYQEQGDDANFNAALIIQEDQGGGKGSVAEQYQWSDGNIAVIEQYGLSTGKDNYAKQEQMGSQNFAYITQRGSRNSAEQYQDGNHWNEIGFGHTSFVGGAIIEQEGKDNFASQWQEGGTQSAFIQQIGKGHSSIQEQSPYNMEEGTGFNRAEVFMFGKNNTSEQYQVGAHNFANVTTGEESAGNMAFQYQGVNDISLPIIPGFTEEPVSFSVPGEVSLHNVAYATQNGSKNASLQIQFGGFNKSTVIQDGNKNGALTVQHGLMNDALVTQPGNKNRAFVNQVGKCNDADILQVGNLNFGSIEQFGCGNIGDIQQFGNSGSGIITQVGMMNYSLIQQY